MSTGTTWTKLSHVYFFVPIISLVLLIAEPAIAKDFNILLLHQTPAEKLDTRPQGRVLIDGGCVEGIEEGLRGFVLSTGSTGDTITVAKLTVTDVMPHEAMCRFETVVDRYMMTKKHRVSIAPAELDPANMFAKAMESYDAGLYERACFYYSKVLEAAPDNELARTRVETCRQHVEATKDFGLTDEEKLAETEHVTMYLEIAQAYRKLKNYARAREYIDRVLAVDDKHPKAVALKRLIPSDA
ncbi:MAG: hypothetical protein GY867_01210, partial [bacterium]|nr:hypothetical protein [bacterium]